MRYGNLELDSEKKNEDKDKTNEGFTMEIIQQVANDQINNRCSIQPQGQQITCFGFDNKYQHKRKK